MLEGLHCRVGDAIRRWSQIWGSWYFPRFLLSVGSCTQMNMASLMVLDWLLTSLWTMLNCSGSTGCPVVVLCRWMGRGSWSVPWLFHPKICQILLCRYWGSLFVGISSGRWCLFYCFWDPCPWGCLTLSLCVGSFEMILYSFPFTHFTKLFPCPWHVWHNYGDVLFVVAAVLWVVVVGIVVVV